MFQKVLHTSSFSQNCIKLPYEQAQLILLEDEKHMIHLPPSPKLTVSQP